MTEILAAFRKAVQDLARPHVLLIVALPILCATVLWLFAGWFFWEPLTQWINDILSASQFGQWIAHRAQGVFRFVSTVIALALLAPGILITVMVITELFTLPGLVNFVAQRYYPQLARHRGASIAGSVANSTIAIVIFALLWLVTLPLWFTGIGALIVPSINSAYLNQRIFRHDALADHASREELRSLTVENRGRLFMLGLLLAVFFYVPFINVLAPALTGLAFTHYQLGRLARLRGPSVATVKSLL